MKVKLRGRKGGELFKRHSL